MPKRLSKEIRGEIERKAEEGLDGPQVQQHLEALYLEGAAGFDTVPHLRTIQSFMKVVKHEDPSGCWRLLDSLPNDVAVIMPVLAEVHTRTGGRRRYLTKREAGVVLKLCYGAPQLEGFDIFLLARAYIRREDLGEPTEDLDLIIAHVSKGDVDGGSAVEGRGGLARRLSLEKHADMEEMDARPHTQTG